MDGRNIVLNDGTVIPGGECGYSDGFLWCWLNGYTMQQAASLFFERTRLQGGADIVLKKNIPFPAGLGGGSADAAAAFVGLNQLWGLDYPLEKLLTIGAKLGADVPFCIAGGCRRATGIGTELENVESTLPMHLVILKPCEGLLTKEIFGGLTLNEQTKHPDTAGAAKAVEAGDMDALIACMGNVLETPAMARRPLIGQALEELMAQGALHARMSGSGSAVFGLFKDEAAAQRAAEALQGKYAECFAAHTVKDGVKIK
jgi:4-diphosphocytidyl-2-C-methyl-D-erythritol kinase